MANELVPTRQEITANMYALRAGLSVVSKEVQNATNALNKAISEKENEKAQVANRLQRQNDKINSIQHSIEEEHRLLSENKEITTKNYLGVSYKMRWFLGLTILTLLLLGVVAYMICSICVTRANIFGEDWLEDAVLNQWFGWWTHDATHYFLEILLLYAFTVLSLGGAITSAVFTIFKLRDLNETIRKNKDVKKERKQAKQMVESVIPQRIRGLQQQLAKENAVLADEQKACKLIIDESKTKYQKAIAQMIQNHVDPAKAVYQSLIQIFSGQIDERDWSSLDYLIYAVETGRADSIKESLQLLDREKQTNRIVAAIQTASKEIAQILNRGFSALSEQMTKSFVILSKQIQTSTAAILGSISQMQQIQESQTALLSAKVSQLTQQQSLNRALMEKANESSEQLVADIHQIAQLENARYNRGY